MELKDGNSESDESDREADIDSGIEDGFVVPDDYVSEIDLEENDYQQTDLQQRILQRILAQ